jgi:hypothetical protein
MPCCKHIIADYVPHIPWIEDLLGTLISFCPIDRAGHMAVVQLLLEHKAVPSTAMPVRIRFS